MEKRFIRFHIKSDHELKQTLMALRNGRSLSALINDIFASVFHIVEKRECELDRLFFPGEMEQTEDMYIMMDETYKGKLFQIQSHFRLRSKAAVLRLLLRIYLGKVARYTDIRLKAALERSHRLWEWIKLHVGKWNKKGAEEIYMLCGYDRGSHLQSILFANSV